MGMEALSGARRLLVVRLDNIGDIIMLSPAIRALKRAAPDARLTLMVSKAGVAAAGLLPGVDEVFVHRALWQDARGDLPFRPAREQLLIEELRSRSFDAAFIFTSVSQSPYPAAYACYHAGIPIRIAQSREFGGAVLSHSVRPLPDDTHQVDRNLHLLREVGVAVDGSGAQALRIFVSAEARARADGLLRSRGLRRDIIAIAPGATYGARRYPLSRYIEVATHLQGMGQRLVVLGGPKDEALGEALVRAVPGVVSLCGQTSLAELAAILHRSRVLIANDSAPMHIGDAVGCPMVILYSGTEREEEWRPRGAIARLLRRPTACHPCYRSECPYALECLAIAPSDVVAEVMALLGQTLGDVADG